VQVTRRGQPFGDYFPDAVWGGREQALLAAQHFRDELLAGIIGPDTRVRRRPPRGRRSKTGIAGVSLERHLVEGRVYHRYVASWQDPDEGPRDAASWSNAMAGSKPVPSLRTPARRAWRTAMLGNSPVSARRPPNAYRAPHPCRAR
jgi:hypothetical protein